MPTHNHDDPNLIFAPSAHNSIAVDPPRAIKATAPAAHTSSPTAVHDGPTMPVDIPPLPNTLMTVEDIGGMTFIRIDCPAVRERQAFALNDAILNLADRTNGKMTMDLTKVAAFSCAWINTLIQVGKRCKVKGGKLILTGLSTQALHTFKQMGLHKHFTIV
jgi:anti-anti-sigma factor